MNKSEFPLLLVQDMVRIKTEVINSVARNSLIRLDQRSFPEEEKRIVTVQGIQELETFYFVIFRPRLENNKPGYQILMRPRSPLSNEELSIAVPSEEVDSMFASWLNLLQGFDAIPLTEEEELFKYYKSEFYDMLGIDDPSSEIDPFNMKEQMALIKFLTYVEVELGDKITDENERSQLLLETDDLKRNLTKFSKRKVGEKLSGIFAKLKLKGIGFLLDFMDVAKKEAMKKFLYSGLDELHMLFNSMIHNH